MQLRSWRDLLAWTPALQPGREAKLARFAATLALFETCFGPLPRILKISGTSGKGSVAAMLEAALLKDGRSVGLFTSPHLICATERIRVGGKEIASPELDDLTGATAPFFRRVVGELGADFRPTFFEALLLLALRAFQLARVDLAIVEVAIGGASDVVSLLPGDFAAITSIGNDHLAEIGPTLADVAADKAGVASPGSTLLLGPAIPADLLEVVRRSAEARGTKVIVMDAAHISGRDRGFLGHEVKVEMERESLGFELPLAGEHQLANLALVDGILAQLEQRGLIASRGCLRGVASTSWPARLEYFPGCPVFVLDAAHNELSFHALRRFLERRRPGLEPESAELLLLLGVSEVDKAQLALEILAPIFARVSFTEGFHRAVPWDDLPPALREKGWRHFEDPLEALNELKRNEAAATIVIAGSLFLAGACREILLRR